MNNIMPRTKRELTYWYNMGMDEREQDVKNKMLLDKRKSVLYNILKLDRYLTQYRKGGAFSDAPLKKFCNVFGEKRTLEIFKNCEAAEDVIHFMNEKDMENFMKRF